MRYNRFYHIVIAVAFTNNPYGFHIRSGTPPILPVVHN